jgi:intracellular septation protein
MKRLLAKYPFTAEQTINIAGEMGPLVAMFIVNGLIDVQAGTWALIISTLLALIVSLVYLGRPPIMPFIAGAVSITFGMLTIWTGDPMWVQIKVTLFNALVAVMLWLGLYLDRSFFQFVFGQTFHYAPEGWRKLTNNVAWFFLGTAVVNELVRQGADGAHIELMNRVLTGVDIWILFKLFIVMPFTALFLYWQVRLMNRYRLPEPSQAPASFGPLT